MNQKALLLGLCSLFAATIAAFFWIVGDEADGPPSARDVARDERGPASPANAEAAVAPVVEAAANATVESAARDAVADAKGKRPIPDDATWLTVTVVDAATEQPVPGAVVGWYDEKAWELLTPRRQRNQWNPESQMLWRQPELVAERVGWTTRSDAEGRARVTVTEHTTVVALHEERFGQLLLRKNTVAPAGGFRVRLVADRTLHVLLLDEQDQPCRAIPMHVVPRVKDKDVGSFRWSSLTYTDESGLAAFPHLQQLRKQAEDEQLDLSQLEWFVRPINPGEEHRGASVAIDAPPKDPIVLRLAAGGVIKVRATDRGQPLATFERAQLQENRANKEHDGYWMAPRIAKVEADGWARFHHVPLNRSFTINDGGNGGLHATTNGPVARGQEVEVELKHGDEAMTLTGRIVDKQRAPVVDTMFAMQVRGPNLRTWTDCRTDEKGRFLVSLGKPRKDNSVTDLYFDLQVERGERPLRALVAPRTLRAGLEDLGDLMLEEGPLLVAGTLMVGDALHTKPVHIDIQTQDPPVGNKPPRWRTLEHALVFVDGKGGFDARGKPGNGPHRLSVHAEEALPSAPVEFRVGTKDLVVRIETGAALAASVLAPPRIGWDSLRAVLVPAKPPSPGDKPDDGRLVAQPDNGQDERYDLQWSAVPRGTYALELRVQTRREPLVRIEGVNVPVPDGGDARLVDIDLRGLVRKLTLQLQDNTGKALGDANGMLFAPGQAEGAEWVGHQFWEPRFTTLIPQGPIDLLLCTQGFRPQSVRNQPNGDTLEVRVETWPRIRVGVADVPQLPKGAELHVTLTPTAGVTGNVRAQWGSSNRGDYMNANGNAELTRGPAEVAIGDGPHAVRLVLHSDKGKHVFEAVQPSQVLPTDADVLLRVTPEQWQRALDAVTKPAK